MTHRRHKAVTEHLRAAILEGRLRPGARLPAERELCRQEAVSRITIRHALRVLEEERLIVRRQGSGTYVAGHPARRIPLQIDYTGSMRDHAPTLRREVSLWRWTTATAELAARLALDENAPMLYAERTDWLEDTPVAWDQAHIPRAFGERVTEPLLTRVDFLEAWSRLGRFAIEGCRQTIEAVSAHKSVCSVLKLKTGQPILRSTELYTTLNARPAGLFVSYYHPARICIASDYRWDRVAPANAGGKGKTR